MTLSSISRISHSLCNLVSSLVSSPLELSLLLLALSISSLLKLLSADCGQFTDLPGSLCVVLKNTGCAFLTSPLSYRVSCLSSGHLSLWLLLCSLLSALLRSQLLGSRLGSARASRHFSARSSAWPAHGSSWLTALLGSTWLLLCSLLSALLCLRLLAAPPLARRGFSRLAALLGPCDSVRHDWLGSRLPAQLGSAWLDWLGSHAALTGCWRCSAERMTRLGYGSARPRLGAAMYSYLPEVL